MLKSALVIVTLGVGAALALGPALWVNAAKGDPFETPRAAGEDLRTVAGQRVFFAHQSVGKNLLDALPGVFEEGGVELPAVTESREAPSEASIVHTKIGVNGDPLGKIEEFDTIMRAGMADAVDVAVLKLCYVDLLEGQKSADEVFTAYRDTFAALTRDYPDTAFVAATAPLTTQQGVVGKLKAALGRGNGHGPEHNVVREKFNVLMRAEYNAPGTLFDIAAIQSTASDGERVAYERDSDTYYAMNEAYAKDPGHLNSEGGAVAASALVAVLADALE